MLSVTTGRILTKDGMDGIYQILQFMTGQELYTHQLSRVAGPCKEALLKQFPQLAGVEMPGLAPKDDMPDPHGWRDEQAKKYGEEFEVEALPKDAIKAKDPIEEAIEMAMRNHGGLIVVDMNRVKKEPANDPGTSHPGEVH